ncbi:hypothetical protein A5844_000194 [Enterococcus sp. 10A9_DIV0425]|uniref:Phosphoesterase n=1 Tax=Candidatus Enterococcus wittei TaxID=1987383 RepID=A0A2C9XP86_9ENTE|nr:metallophosphoesterase [Enterococcus sp. 10A9_DIV0425]OTP11979.1 hypothetical protein A5844_000194 [Enterococcus sp. 10A9_DIV0425]THE16039.1 metallophosphoesterase [Enterococcus hirae]
MRYLVVSDNHGDRKILQELLDRYKQEVDFFFHCGDSELADDDSLWQTYYGVQGNCDFGTDFKTKRLIDTGEDQVYMTHGHLSNVRFGLTQLALEAEEQQATIALFGHTHQLGCEFHQGILFLNPGSISQPRGPIMIPAYALIDRISEGLHVQYYNRRHQPMDKLAFDF